MTQPGLAGGHLQRHRVERRVIARRVGGEAGSSRGQLRDEDLQASAELGQLFAEGLAMGAL